MDKTRKAFVVLAAAVTAGHAGGCGSNAISSEDAGTVDGLADASLPDGAADLIANEDSVADAGAVDTTTPDSLNALDGDVLLRMDASVSPDGTGPLVMPAGTLYDVLTREHLA